MWDRNQDIAIYVSDEKPNMDEEQLFEGGKVLGYLNGVGKRNEVKTVEYELPVSGTYVVLQNNYKERNTGYDRILDFAEIEVY